LLLLALVVDIMWIVAPLAEWSSRLGDIVWLGAFALVALGAAAVAYYYRNSVDQPAWTWPSDRDVAFLILVIMLFGVIIWVMPVPFDTDAQGFGYLSLLLRESGEYTTLAPWHPEIDYLYSPGQISLIAYLSARFDFSIASIELMFSAAAAVLFVWMAYDLGSELEGPRGARAFMLAAVIGIGLFTAFMDSHYTALLALDFSLAFLIFVLRFLDSWRWSSALFASICLAGVPLSQPDTTIALMIGYIPWLLVIWFSKPRPRFGAWLVLVAVIPLVALGITAPWLISITDLLGSSIESPFDVNLDHWRTLVFMHGGIIVLLAAGGVLIGIVRRRPAHLLMITWLVTIVEFSTLGLLEENLPDLMEPLLKYDYPFSLAWHGPIIPYMVLGGTALLWLADRLGAERVDRWVRRLALPVVALGIAALVAGAVYLDPLLDESKNYLDIHGAFSSEADVDAMLWLRDNAPQEARILNHPGPYEGDWVPVIAERDSVYFRPQPFFRDVALTEQEQDDLRGFWEDPTSDDAAALLEQYNVRYVLVPQVFGDPDRSTDMIRWRDPVEEAAQYDVAAVREAAYLRLVYEQDGAQVYEVIPAE
jgi:Ca2+/Na+ antiporter